MTDNQKLSDRVAQEYARPEAIIVDLDGTLCDLSHRLHFIQGEKKDWDGFFANVHMDKPLHNMLDIVMALADTYKIILCSGRPERAREATRQWLFHNGCHFDDLYMRKDKDHREDHVIKQEALQEIQKKYTVIAAIDDRKQVVDMWRRNNILCLQCAPGNF